MSVLMMAMRHRFPLTGLAALMILAYAGVLWGAGPAAAQEEPPDPQAEAADPAPSTQDANGAEDDGTDDDTAEPSDPDTADAQSEFEALLRELGPGFLTPQELEAFESAPPAGLDSPFGPDMFDDAPAAGAEPSGLSGLLNFDSVLETFEPGPDDPPERRLAWLFVELKTAADADEAAFVAEEIEALWSDIGDPTAVLLTNRARAAASIGELVLARRLADGATQLANNSADAWVASSAIALAQSDIARAISDLEQALVLEPRRYDALLTLAALFESLENWAGAYDAYADVAALYPHHPFAQARMEAVRVRAQGREL